MIKITYHKTIFCTSYKTKFIFKSSLQILEMEMFGYVDIILDYSCKFRNVLTLGVINKWTDLKLLLRF